MEWARKKFPALSIHAIYCISVWSVLKDSNKHLIKEIEHFFQVYKDLEQKVVDVEGWGDVNEAFSIIKECTDRFNQIENKPAGLFSIR